jgi:hypothetical protein
VAITISIFDQYDNLVPDDLRILPDYHTEIQEIVENWKDDKNPSSFMVEFFTSLAVDINIIMKARWWKLQNGILLASKSEIGDAGDTLENYYSQRELFETYDDIKYIDLCFHRWNPEDGFYHA